MEKHQEKIKWLCNILLITGAVLISIHPYFAKIPHTFVMFALGHILYSIIYFRNKDKASFSLNMGLLALDIYAIVYRLIN